MQSPDKTIYEQLQTDWTVSSTQSTNKSKVTWRRGEPTDLTGRFVKRKISIEVGQLVDAGNVRPRRLEKHKHRELVPIHVWMDIKPYNDDSIVKLKDTRQEIIDEIRRIIKLRQRSLTNISYAEIGAARFLDDITEEHVLHWMCEVSCSYET